MKLKEFRNELIKKKIDIAIFYNLDVNGHSGNMFYFSGYKDIGFLIIPAKKKPFLVVPKGELSKAKGSLIKKAYVWQKEGLFLWLKNKFRQQKIRYRKIGIDKRFCSVEIYQALKKRFKGSRIKDVAQIFDNIREQKTEKELQYIRKACKITSNIYRKFAKKLGRFKTEQEAAAFLTYETRRLGCELAFNPIVASGRNGSTPHHDSNGKISKGFCVVDFGVKYKGYCSDCTRTFYIGKPSKKEVELYNMLLKVQKSTINYISIGKKSGGVYDFANKALGKYAKYFIHGLGHGLGIEIHEKPNLKPDIKEKIKENTPLTIEPGIYFPEKFGIRIEDTILLTKNKKEILTTFPKHIHCITLRS